MALEGLHHVTCITAEASGNVDFYARVLGLRLVKKTVNFDAPDVYHLYYGDETGAPGSIMTFFEFPDAAPGRAGAGQVRRVDWRVGSADALDFWEDRLDEAGAEPKRAGDAVLFSDPEGLQLGLVIGTGRDAPLTARADGIPAEHALQGFAGVRAYAPRGVDDAPVLRALGMDERGDGEWVALGDERHAHVEFEPPPAQPALQGAGSVHHVAWSAADDAELERLRDAVAGAGMRPTPIIDRQYFHSVYFRIPSGTLFELATRDIGFHVDEPIEHLGESLRLPPQHEHLRDHLERHLVPIENPRAAA